MSGTDAVAAVFARCRAENRAALVGYLPAGLPTPAAAPAIAVALAEGGADIVEVGLPYSDPVMEGVTIQQAMDLALHRGSRIADFFAVVEKVAATGVPAVGMTYWAPIERYGVDRFAASLDDAGGAGLITPDLLPDEAEAWVAASDTHGFARVFLVAPSSTDERIAMTTRYCRGFVYATSVMGVTGTRTATSSLAPALVARVRAASTLPVGVGLGVSNAGQAAEVAGYADAVIVGSALVRRVLDAPDAAAAAASVRALAAELAQGVRSARR